MCEFIIFKLHQNEDLCKKLEVSILKNMDRILKKNIFQGVVPPDLPPSGPFRGSDPMCEFIIFKLHQNEDLCKKTRGLYPKKHGQDSQKNIFQGVVPPDLPPSGPFRGSDPLCEFIIFKLHQNEDLCKKLEESILKNMDRIFKNHFSGGGTP